MRFRPHRSNVLMLNLTAVSSFCALVLLGLFAYRGGSLLPATDGAGSQESLGIWIMWGILIAVPAVTAVLWLLRMRQAG